MNIGFDSYADNRLIVVDEGAAGNPGAALRWARHVAGCLGDDLVVRRRMPVPGATEDRSHSGVDVSGAWLIVTEIGSNGCDRNPPIEALTQRARHAPGRAIALVPKGFAIRKRIRSIVVAVDDTSDVSCSTVACRFAQTFCATLHVVFVMPVESDWVPSTNPCAVWRHEYAEMVDLWSAECDPLGVDYSVEIIEGNLPAREWIRFADRRHADAVVLNGFSTGDWPHSRHADFLTDLAVDCGLPVLVSHDRPTLPLSADDERAVIVG